MWNCTKSLLITTFPPLGLYLSAMILSLCAHSHVYPPTAVAALQKRLAMLRKLQRAADTAASLDPVLAGLSVHLLAPNCRPLAEALRSIVAAHRQLRAAFESGGLARDAWGVIFRCWSLRIELTKHKVRGCVGGWVLCSVQN